MSAVNIPNAMADTPGSGPGTAGTYFSPAVLPETSAILLEGTVVEWHGSEQVYVNASRATTRLRVVFDPSEVGSPRSCSPSISRTDLHDPTKLRLLSSSKLSSVDQARITSPTAPDPPTDASVSATSQPPALLPVGGEPPLLEAVGPGPSTSSVDAIAGLSHTRSMRLGVDGGAQIAGQLTATSTDLNQPAPAVVHEAHTSTFIRPRPRAASTEASVSVSSLRKPTVREPGRGAVPSFSPQGVAAELLRDHVHHPSLSITKHFPFASAVPTRASCPLPAVLNPDPVTAVDFPRSSHPASKTTQSQSMPPVERLLGLPRDRRVGSFRAPPSHLVAASPVAPSTPPAPLNAESSPNTPVSSRRGVLNSGGSKQFGWGVRLSPSDTSFSQVTQAAPPHRQSGCLASSHFRRAKTTGAVGSGSPIDPGGSQLGVYTNDMSRTAMSDSLGLSQEAGSGAASHMCSSHVRKDTSMAAGAAALSTEASREALARSGPSIPADETRAGTLSDPPLGASSLPEGVAGGPSCPLAKIASELTESFDTAGLSHRPQVHHGTGVENTGAGAHAVGGAQRAVIASADNHRLRTVRSAAVDAHGRRAVSATSLPVTTHAGSPHAGSNDAARWGSGSLAQPIIIPAIHDSTRVSGSSSRHSLKPSSRLHVQTAPVMPSDVAFFRSPDDSRFSLPCDPAASATTAEPGVAGDRFSGEGMSRPRPARGVLYILQANDVRRVVNSSCDVSFYVVPHTQFRVESINSPITLALAKEMLGGAFDKVDVVVLQEVKLIHHGDLADALSTLDSLRYGPLLVEAFESPEYGLLVERLALRHEPVRVPRLSPEGSEVVYTYLPMSCVEGITFLIETALSGCSLSTLSLLLANMDRSSADAQHITRWMMNSSHNALPWLFSWAYDSGQAVHVFLALGEADRWRTLLALVRHGPGVIVDERIVELMKLAEVGDQPSDRLNLLVEQACYGGSATVLEYILSTRVGIVGGDALCAVASRGSIQLVELLLQGGAQVNVASSDGSLPLCEAAKAGSLNTVARLMRERDARLDLADASGWAPVHHAAGVGVAEVLQLFSDSGVDLEARLPDGQPPLNIACARGHYAAVVTLLRCGASVDVADSRGYTAIHEAAEGGFARVVTALLEAGVHPSERTLEGHSPIWLAARSGFLRVVDALLEARADVDTPSASAVTPLMCAARRGYSDIVKRLLAASASVASVGKGGVTALHLAAQSGAFPCVDALLLAGAPVNAVKSDNTSALLLAASRAHPHIIVRLVEAGAVIDCARKTGVTPLWMAAQGGSLECVEELLERGAQPHKARTDGTTPLLIAAQNGYTQIVDVLLAYGADPNASKQDGVTPLMVAAEGGHVDILALLLRSGAFVDSKRSDGLGPLHVASRAGHPAVLDALIRAGAECNGPNADGVTPLLAAAQAGHVVVVERLITAGANPNQSSYDGATPLIVAAENGHTEVLDWLLAAGADVTKTRCDGVSAIVVSAHHGHVEVLSRLMNARPPDSDSRDLEACLTIAAERGHSAVVDRLIRAGADVSFGLQVSQPSSRRGLLGLCRAEKRKDLQSRPSPALFAAAQAGHDAVVERLLRAGADPHAPIDPDGPSPLLIAAKNGHDFTVKLLLASESLKRS